jgi:hypothetical protein
MTKLEGVVLARKVSVAGAIVIVVAVVGTLLARRLLGGGERASLHCDDPSALRLATQIDVGATMLLAAPPRAGVRAACVADDERQVLLDVSRKLEYVPGGSFARLRYELSIGE